MKRIAEGATRIFLACGLSKYSDKWEHRIFENSTGTWHFTEYGKVILPQEQSDETN